mmetsp:Transcript_29885/g.51030  ORF Transcript_29885/g.51030 Transcript_29885/m.51030 type:complete len:192 (-) Transcript_29885:122-697(-)
MKFFAAFLAIAGVSSTLSVEFVGSLRGNYDSVAAAVAVSDTKEVQAGGYASESSFEEKKRKADKALQKLWYWTECEGCDECSYWKEMMKEATSGPKKKNAKKHYEEAKAATLRAAAHLSVEGKKAWEAFQEEHGADAAERMADDWMKRHASSYDEAEDSFNHIDIDAFKELDPELEPGEEEHPPPCKCLDD